MKSAGKTVLAGLLGLALIAGVYYLNHPGSVKGSDSSVASVRSGTIPAGDKEVLLQNLGMY